MSNKINILGCGGAGISIISKLENGLTKLGEGFSEVSINYIDTSTTTIQKHYTEEERVNNFFMIKETSHSKDSINGSGGERATNSVAISSEIKRYLDLKKIDAKVTGEIFVVVSSASGGSGSVVSALLTKALIERNIPTVIVLVGDSSNHMYALNTRNTIATFDKISKMVDKPLPIAYLNNQEAKGDNLTVKSEVVDKLVFKFLSVLSLFMSGKNSEIDYQDMLSIIDPTAYDSITIPAGLYNISIFKGDIELPDYSKPMLGRTLTIPDKDGSPGITLHHHKVGEVLAENAFNIFKDQWPLHIVTHHGMFKIELGVLDKVITKMSDILKEHTTDDLFGTEQSKTDDDTGLVL
jgi:hypothetical protein